MQETETAEANVHEGRLHPRHHAIHPAHIDVAGEAAPVGPLHMQLLQGTAGAQCHAGLKIADVNEQLGRHRAPTSPLRQHGTLNDLSKSSVSRNGKPTTAPKLPSMRLAKTPPMPWMP